MRGIRRHGAGWQAYVTVAGRFYSRAFPAPTPVEVMQAWRAQQRLVRRAVARASRKPPGTLAADVDRYLVAVAAMPTIRERQRHLALWQTALGPYRLRETIRPDEIGAVLQGWLLEGLAPQTVRLRRSALAHVWTVLDGRGAPNPVRSVPAPPAPPPVPRALPVGLVPVILQHVKGRRSLARLAVLAATGLPNKSVAALTPQAVRRALETGVLRVAGRQKGQGAPGREIPLSPDMRAALTLLDATGAYGRFSGASLLKTFKRAAATIGLTDVRVYDLRHTIGTELARRVDLQTVGRLLGHADRRTTARYAQAALMALDQAAVAQLPRVLPDDLGQPKANEPAVLATRQNVRKRQQKTGYVM